MPSVDNALHQHIVVRDDTQVQIIMMVLLGDLKQLRERESVRERNKWEQVRNAGLGRDSIWSTDNAVNEVDCCLISGRC